MALPMTKRKTDVSGSDGAERRAAVWLARRVAQWIRSGKDYMDWRFENPDEDARPFELDFARLIICSSRNPAEFLRLVADVLDEKVPKRYDREIEEAYEKASRRAWPPPTFAQFRKEFPRRKITERSLRRSLKRHGFVTSPDKRGRPKNRETKAR